MSAPVGRSCTRTSRGEDRMQTFERRQGSTMNGRRRTGRNGASIVSKAVMLAIAVLVVLVSLVAPAAAHMIELDPSAEECFFEDLNPGDQMTLTYQVGGGGHLDIDVRLTDPNGDKLFELLRKDTGQYSLTAQHTGRYTYCFSNKFSTMSDKTVSFNVHGIIYVPDDGQMLPIEREIRDLAAGLQAVKDEQEYLVIRERVHRNTAESTFNRVKWWSVIQGFLLLGACGFQVYFVKRQFEVRRMI